jgi:hypothetical protein
LCQKRIETNERNKGIFEVILLFFVESFEAIAGGIDQRI